MIIGFFVAALLLGPSSNSVAHQSLETKLRAKVENYVLNEETFPNALVKVSESFEIPIGIEWIRSPETMSSVNFTSDRTTAERVLDFLTKRFGYEFQIADDIVHVFPRERLKDEHDFLNLRIESFAVRNEFVEQASRRLHAIVGRAVTPPRPSSLTGDAGSYSVAQADRRVSFVFQNATVREILDKFSISSGLKIWIVTFPDKATKMPSGFYRTVALHISGSIADEHQPIWVFLPWGAALRALQLR